MIDIRTTAAMAGLELSEIESRISHEQIDAFMDAMIAAKKVYVCGAGRSLLMLRCFAMRLMHIGYEAYVVGDTTTPAFTEGDLLIIGSASGETTNLISIAKRAKGYGGMVGLCSIFSESSLAELADTLIRIPAYTDKLPENEENKKNSLPGGSMFEIGMLVLFDTMIISLAEKKRVATDVMFVRHANLE